jgi:hypothetical protein
MDFLNARAGVRGFLASESSEMHLYGGFSLNISSQLELPGLRQGSGPPDVTIRLGSIGRTGAFASLDEERAFPHNIGGFHISHGREIVADLLPNAELGAVRTLLAGRFMGYLLRQRGHLVLHASAVAVEGKAVLFMGESGAGKSTTAASFHFRGHPVLADDVAALSLTESGVELHPAWPGLRLLDDSREAIGAQTPVGFEANKHLYSFLGAVPPGPVPVKRIYFLEYGASGEQPSVHASMPSRLPAVALLNTHSLLRAWRADSELRQVNLDRAAAFAAATAVHRLVRPRSLKALPRIVDFVESDVMTDD